MRPFDELANRLAKRFSVDFAGDSPLLILGSGRSGTTWLAELCNYRNDFRYIFEPLNPDTSRRAQSMDSWAPEPGTDCPDLVAFIQGKQTSPWSLRHNRRLFAQRRLIKEIRLNLAVPWIQNHFPKAKLIKLVRNPIDVAISRQRLDELSDDSRWVWKPSLSELLGDANVQNALNQDQKTALANCVGRGVVLETIADWCLNNLVFALDTYTVHYERLVTEPEKSLKRIFEYAEILYSDEVLEFVNKSSSTTRRSDNDSEIQYHAGTELLQQDELDKATSVLNCFAIDRLYANDWTPLD